MDGEFKLKESIEAGNVSVGIIGLGYVGLPTAIGFLDAGFNVWGVDISEHVVNTILKGENPTGDPEINDIIPAPNTKKWDRMLLYLCDKLRRISLLLCTQKER